MSSEHSTITAMEFNDAIRNSGSDIIIVDVRTRDEFAGESIPTAVNIPLNEIESRIGTFSQYEQIYIFCQGGGRSKRTYDLLTSNGIKNVIDLQGGIVAWKQAGFPTTR